MLCILRTGDEKRLVAVNSRILVGMLICDGLKFSDLNLRWSVWMQVRAFDFRKILEIRIKIPDAKCDIRTYQWCMVCHIIVNLVMK